MSRIIRRLNRPDNVTEAMPESVALAMDTRGKKSAPLAYVGLSFTNLGLTFMKFQEDQYIISQAADQNPDMDLGMEGKLPSMFHTLWVDNSYRKVPGSLVGTMVCPQHDLLIDEQVSVISETHITFKATAYDLGLKSRRDITNVEVVDIPVEEIELLMNMSGSLSIDIDDGKITFTALGIFGGKKCLEIANRICAMDLPSPRYAEDDDDDDDDQDDS
jgi:hypothetical protein